MWATQGSGISEQPINKQVIDHLSDGQSDPNRTDNRRTIKAEHDSSSFLSAISPRTSLSNALLYLSLVSLPSSLPPSLPPALRPLLMNSPCSAPWPMDKFLVCSPPQGQSLVRKPIELWSNTLLDSSAASLPLPLSLLLSLSPSLHPSSH